MKRRQILKLFGIAPVSAIFHHSAMLSAVEHPVKSDLSQTNIKSQGKQLIIACREGDLSTVKEILNSGFYPNTYIDLNPIEEKIPCYRKTFPLVEAVYSDQLEIVKELIKFGADVDMICTDDLFKVPSLAHVKSTAVLKTLIEAGANFNFSNMEWPWYYHFLNEAGYPCFEVLVNIGAKLTMPFTLGGQAVSALCFNSSESSLSKHLIKIISSGYCKKKAQEEIDSEIVNTNLQKGWTPAQPIEFLNAKILKLEDYRDIVANMSCSAKVHECDC